MAAAPGERARTVTVDEAEYLEACEDFLGWCPDCQAFSRESTEPDAHGYDCPSCGGRNVMGAEQALMLGVIELT